MLLNKFNFTSLGKCFPTGAKEGVLLLSIASLRPKMIFQISPKYPFILHLRISPGDL